MSGGPNPIRNVSDTALWVAIYRAMESERPDALFRDPFARGLAGERGEAIVRSMPRGAGAAWPMIVRTAVMDELIVRAVARDGVATVLNLAAGLDTRAYRLPLPPSLRWFHVDLPGMVDYVSERLRGAAPACVVDTLPADLTDPAARRTVLTRVAHAPAPSLAVAEGLLIYLQPEQVAALARDLATVPGLRYWLIDLASPRLLKMLRKRWQSRLAEAGAPLVFAPEEGTAFFEPFGWREAEYRSLWEEANRLGRTPRSAWVWNLIGRLMPASRRESMRRMSGMVLLERI